MELGLFGCGGFFVLRLLITHCVPQWSKWQLLTSITHCSPSFFVEIGRHHSTLPFSQHLSDLASKVELDASKKNRNVEHTAEGKIQTARLEETEDNTPKCTQSHPAVTWSLLELHFWIPKGTRGWTRTQWIYFSRDEWILYHQCFIDNWVTAKVQAKNNVLATIRNHQDVFQLEGKSQTNSCALSILKNEGKTEKCGAGPSREDRFAPASGKTLFSFQL